MFELNQELNKQSSLRIFIVNTEYNVYASLFEKFITQQLAILNRLAQETAEQTLIELTYSYSVNYILQKQMLTYMGYGEDTVSLYLPELAFTQQENAQKSNADLFVLPDGSPDTSSEQLVQVEDSTITPDKINAPPLLSSPALLPRVPDNHLILDKQVEPLKKKMEGYLNRKHIPRSLFLSRAYHFKDEPQRLVTREEKDWANFHEDGTIWVDNKEIFWKKKNGFYKNMSMVCINGKTITQSAFQKRKYYFKDNPQQWVTSRDKKCAEFREDGTIWVGNREIVWDQKKGLYQHATFIILDGKEITREAFNKRVYYFADNPEQTVTVSEKNRAEICEDNTVWVDGRQIIWGHTSPGSKSIKRKHNTDAVAKNNGELVALTSDGGEKSHPVTPKRDGFFQPAKKMKAGSRQSMQLEEHPAPLPDNTAPPTSFFSLPKTPPQLTRDELSDDLLCSLIVNLESSLFSWRTQQLQDYIRDKNFPAVVIECSDLLLQFGGFSPLLVLRGEAYRRLNYLNLALDDLNKFLDKESNHLIALRARHSVHSQLNNWTEASKDSKTINLLEWADNHKLDLFQDGNDFFY